ncbi:MAG: hypothetical protein FRX48_01108 [Lasallia pustulata]|uniref:Uncharacterized protein n=1 Tax=Lasallia pustulata TaxID=136370 RepID=A0A5M8Q2L5_9LECA|nr:MAG: hypothetical protein FRX48_01108 [Lasallia pustulata]
MKLLTALTGSCLINLAQAAIAQGSVYTFDADPQPAIAGLTSPSITPETARLVLACRLGLSQYHSLHNADETTIEYLNRFGGRQKRLLPSYQDELPLGKLLVMVEGVGDPTAVFDSNIATPAFTISRPPSPQDNLQLSSDFLSQDEHQRSRDRSCIAEFPEGSGFRGGLHARSDYSEHCDVEDLYRILSEMRDALDGFEAFEVFPRFRQYGYGPGDTTAIFHISLPEMIAREDGTSSARYKSSIESLRLSFQTLKADSIFQESTIILMPPAQKAAKRTGNPYGTYEVPSKSIYARQQQIEEPLSAAPIPEASPQLKQPHTLYNSTFRKGILPICHSDEATCESATDSCAGHGKCVLKYTTGSGENLTSTCYACQCGNTTRVNADGTVKTTFWGGPACQKKDVSSPFFLIAGFTIVLVATVSWGIGLMFSIGQEELPSVIGAGVAGPRAK